jgi:hypothetical protein
VISAFIHVGPGHHGSGTMPAGFFTGPVNCIVLLPSMNKVSGGNLTVDFYALENGQATAAIPVTNFRLNLPVCK